MTADNTAHALTITLAVGTAVLGILFLSLAIAGRVLTQPSDRTRLGTALGHVCGSQAIFLTTLVVFFVARITRATDQPIQFQPPWLDLLIRLALAGSITWALIAALIALPLVAQALRNVAAPEDFGTGVLFWHIHEAVIVGEARSGRIVRWNPSATAMFGYSEQEATSGMLLEDLVAPHLKARHREGLRH